MWAQLRPARVKHPGNVLRNHFEISHEWYLDSGELIWMYRYNPAHFHVTFEESCDRPANHEKQQRRIKPLAPPGLKYFIRGAGRTLWSQCGMKQRANGAGRCLSESPGPCPPLPHPRPPPAPWYLDCIGNALCDLCGAKRDGEIKYLAGIKAQILSALRF